MAEKPRTAAQVAAPMVAALVPSAVWNVMSMISRQRVEADAERVLDSWRRELLADGWTFLPGEMPEDCRLVARVHRNGGRDVLQAWWVKQFQEWWDAESFNLEDDGWTVYAHRPLPEPPEVPR